MSGKTAGIGIAALAAVVATAWVFLERPTAPGGGDDFGGGAGGTDPKSVEAPAKLVFLVGSVRATDGTSLEGRTLWIRPAGADASSASGSVTLGTACTFRVGGLAPGRYWVGCRPTRDMSEQNPPFLLASGEPFVVEAGATEVRVDFTVAPCGILRVQANDARLPASSSDASRPSTDAQRAFGEKCRVDVRRADGQVVAEQRGIADPSCGALSGLSLLPGKYVVHAEFPGDAPREVAVAIEPGKTAEVSLAR
jgi:hypothetical protein